MKGKFNGKERSKEKDTESSRKGVEEVLKEINTE
jgi:hypothetical protein